MGNLISFSLWGSDRYYMNGCIENIALAREIYPGWNVRFYCDDKVSESFINVLRNMGAQVVVKKTYENSWEGLFWRFMPASELGIDVFISRDIDSRLNWRERAAVDEWLSSGKLLHSMRDHVEHNVPILGGMWGCRSGLIDGISKMIFEWGKYNYKGCDQDFLRETIWENFKSQAIVHDRYYNGLIICDGKYLERKLDNPEVDEYGVESTDKKIDGEIITPEYIYDPIKFFGEHDIRPFPEHNPMNHGTYVGEIIR